MSNSFVGRVNLQILSTRHHLALLLDEKTANDRIRNRGVLESAAWHLGRAYDAYLCEVGANYKLANLEGNKSAPALCDALHAMGKDPGEASELLELERVGWVSDLLRALASVNSNDEKANLATPASTLGRDELRLIDVSTRRVELSEPAVKEWLASFKELVERQRAVMIEY